MAVYVLGIRGTYLPALVKEALKIADILSNEPYRSCFDYTVYIVIRDKKEKCYESGKMVRYLEARPMIVLLSLDEFKKELAKVET